MTTSRRVVAPLAALCALAAMLAGPPSSADAGQPRGVHVAFGEDPTSTATVVWFTDGADDPGTMIEYGTSAEQLDHAASGVSQVAPGEGYPAGTVLVHEVALAELPAGTRIHYRVGSPGAWSDVHAFETAPAEASSFSFVAYGDQGTGERARAVTAAVLDADPDLVVVAGDLSYAQPGTPTFPEWPLWDVWFDEIEPLAASRAFMVAVGNHECESIGCTDSYRARFALPGDELTYSFDYLNAHFLMFLSDRATWQREGRLADALAFAEQDLAAAAERKRAGEIDWIFVVQHHPLYGSQRGDLVVDELLERKTNPALIALEERLLHAYDVDVLIAGHNHNYERSLPMIYGRPTADAAGEYQDPLGFIQVTTGGAGRGLAPQDPPLPGSWSAARAARFHYTEFTIEGKTLTFTATATDGGQPQVIDSFTLRRG